MSFNELSFAEAERLALLAEEMGEAIQAIGKILRHGYAAIDPTSRKQHPPTNREMLEHEIGDILAVIELMYSELDILPEKVVKATTRKREALPKWTHHQT